MGAQTLIEIPRKQLLVDAALQPRLSGIDPEHVRELEEAPGAWPPLVAVETDGRYSLVDGFHRLAAAERLGLTAVTITVVEPPADGDLRSLAFRLNALHGRPLSLADRKAEAFRLLKRIPERSSRSIGKACGLNHETIERLRQEAAASGEIRHMQMRRGERAGGYAYSLPARRPGELPEEGLGEAIGRGITGLVGGREVAQRRRAASYLGRVVVALDDQFALADWSSEALAQAAWAQLGEAEAALLGARLGAGALNLLRAARLLGYSPEGEEA